MCRSKNNELRNMWIEDDWISKKISLKLIRPTLREYYSSVNGQHTGNGKQLVTSRMLPMSRPSSWPVTSAGMHSLQCLIIFNATWTQKSVKAMTILNHVPMYIMCIISIYNLWHPRYHIRNFIENNIGHIPSHRPAPPATAPQSLRWLPPVRTTASELPWQHTNKSATIHTLETSTRTRLSCS